MSLKGLAGQHASRSDHGLQPVAENRYRDCIVCDKSFKKPHEGEYRCETCRAKVLENERRDRAGKQLLDANARIKP